MSKSQLRRIGWSHHHEMASLLLATILGFTGVIAAAAEARGNPESDEPVHSDVRASSFQEVTPGATTREELIKAAGKPSDEVTDGAESILTYKLGPFPRVEMIVTNDVVDSIVVHLETPAPPAAIAKELGLSTFTPSIIYGEQGEVLGQVYPERGVAFSFELNSQPPQVTELVLEPIAAEFFLLRAKDTSLTNYTQKVADCNYVLQADKQNTQARWIKAEVYKRSGHYERALANIEAALSKEGSNPRYRLLRAEIRYLMGQHATAAHEVEFVLGQKNSDLIRGKAKLLLGEILADGPKRDYHAAMKQHLAAIELLGPLVAADAATQRREVRELLIQLHLSIANHITHGKWSGKQQSAPEWLRIAKELNDQYASEDSGDDVMRLNLLHKALGCYVGMEGIVDPTEVVQQLTDLSGQLIGKASDELRKRQLQWLTVDALSEAVRLEQLRGQAQQAMRYSQQAESLMQQLAGTEESSKRLHQMRGQLHFLVGSTFAVAEGDHGQAVQWYEKALPYLTKIRPTAGSIDQVRHGERFVSMGVSFWETNSRQEAIRLTESGMKIMSKAIDSSKLDRKPLGVAYGNLASMYDSVGRSVEARRLAAKAARLEPGRGRSISR